LFHPLPLRKRSWPPPSYPFARFFFFFFQISRMVTLFAECFWHGVRPLAVLPLDGGVFFFFRVKSTSFWAVYVQASRVQTLCLIPALGCYALPSVLGPIKLPVGRRSRHSNPFFPFFLRRRRGHLRFVPTFLNPPAPRLFVWLLIGWPGMIYTRVHFFSFPRDHGRTIDPRFLCRTGTLILIFVFEPLSLGPAACGLHDSCAFSWLDPTVSFPLFLHPPPPPSPADRLPFFHLLFLPFPGPFPIHFHPVPCGVSESTLG